MRIVAACLGLALLLAVNAAPVANPTATPDPVVAQTARPQAGAAPAASAPQAAASPAAQPDLTAVKADFIPGDKTIFYDDFTDMAGDEPPPHWKVRGGAVELKVGPGIRQLTATTERVRLAPMLQGLPKNFTLETEVKFDHPEDTRSIWYLHDKTWDGPDGPDAALLVFLQSQGDRLGVQVRHRGKEGVEDLAHASVPVDFNQPVKVSSATAWCASPNPRRISARSSRRPAVT
jgi:hypothetical protein